MTGKCAKYTTKEENQDKNITLCCNPDLLKGEYRLTETHSTGPPGTVRVTVLITTHTPSREQRG